VKLTRRSFLAVTGASPFALTRGVCLGREGCLVLGSGARGLSESAAGYLQSSGHASSRTPMTPGRAAAVVAPAAIIDRSSSRRLRDAAWSGQSVLVELGLAFVDDTEAGVQRSLLADAFDVGVREVVHLWHEGRSRVPYVRYDWPVAAWVRDYSRAVVLDGAGWRVIAAIEGRPVAVRRRVGRGAVTILGSPLGPALRAGDREAVTWFAAFLDGAAPSHALSG